MGRETVSPGAHWVFAPRNRDGHRVMAFRTNGRRGSGIEAHALRGSGKVCKTLHSVSTLVST